MNGRELTAREVFFAQFDAIALGQMSAYVHESERPGALEALRDWGESRRLEISGPYGDGAVRYHEIELGSVHSIMVISATPVVVVAGPPELHAMVERAGAAAEPHEDLLGDGALS